MRQNFTLADIPKKTWDALEIEDQRILTVLLERYTELECTVTLSGYTVAMKEHVPFADLDKTILKYNLLPNCECETFTHALMRFLNHLQSLQTKKGMIYFDERKNKTSPILYSAMVTGFARFDISLCAFYHGLEEWEALKIYQSSNRRRNKIVRLVLQKTHSF